MKKQSIKLSHVGRRELEEGSRVNCHNQLFFVLLPFFIGMGLSGCASSPLPPHCRQPGTLVEQPIGAAGASPSPRISRGGALFRTGWLRGLSLFHSIRSSYTGALLEARADAPSWVTKVQRGLASTTRRNRCVLGCIRTRSQPHVICSTREPSIVAGAFAGGRSPI
jgi:hypothetical protein